MVSDNALQKYFGDLRAYGHSSLNPASTRLALPPLVLEGLVAHAPISKDAQPIFSGPDRSKPEGARDYAIIIMCRVSLNVTEIAPLNTSSITWSQRWPMIKFKAKNEMESILPLPPDVKIAIYGYLKLNRRSVEHIARPIPLVTERLYSHEGKNSA